MDKSSKTCTKCKLTKNASEFHKLSVSKDGLYPSCKSCKAQYVKDNAEKYRKISRKHYSKNKAKYIASAKAYKSANKDKLKNAYLIRTYGITLAQYSALLAAQKNLCAICKQAGELDTDHSHVTGKVRGLLCSRCNTAIGLLGDSSSITQSATEYLQNHE